MAINLWSNWLALLLVFVTIMTVSLVFYLVIPIYAQNNNEVVSLTNLIKEGSPHLGSLSAPVTIIDLVTFNVIYALGMLKIQSQKLMKHIFRLAKLI